MSSPSPVVAPKEMDLKSLSGFSISELEDQADRTAYGIGGGLLGALRDSRNDQ